MIAQSFEYHVPKTLAEASRLAAQFGAEGKILAGGHSLVPMMKLRLATPKHLIDVGRIADLSYIREDDGKIMIGAMTTHYQAESSDLLKSKCPLFPETAREIGDAQVRNKGTIGGRETGPPPSWPSMLRFKPSGPRASVGFRPASSSSACWKRRSSRVKFYPPFVCPSWRLAAVRPM